MKDKTRYLIDDSNRLVIRKGRTKEVVSGRLFVDKKNRLIYLVNGPTAWKKQNNIPTKIVFNGRWKLNQSYDLEFILSETKEQYKGDRLVIKGEIIATDRDVLAFEVKVQDKNGNAEIQLIKLSGVWFADEFNRISFSVKQNKEPDILTLEGAWQVNRNQQISYTYERKRLKKKTRIFRVLTFEGFWSLDSANRLTYVLDKSSKSCFNFRVQLESPNLLPNQRMIKYRIGVGLRKEKSYREKIISLFGVWKCFSKGGLTFQMDCGDNKWHSMEFGANVNMGRNDEITLSLLTKKKEALGINITFNHKFLKQLDAETFLRLQKTSKESAIQAGVRIPF